ncbi:creatininase family protein [Synechococcus sp. PCC 7336]|uniref:creatininase family protein n=1 Tax=Synechococcus sp. PCC 7336 TaxID=195250 RepID=UPI00037518F6|nr:creatininase family protein [Synechococcus sp. PCC 7336]
MNKLAQTTDRPVLWEELTWEEIAALRESGRDLVILPIGATEQHSLHLPVGVDTFSVMAVAEGVSAMTGFPVLPPLAYGVSLGHTSKWPGTISLRPETLSAIVLEIAEWIVNAGFSRLVILNGHYTNWAPLRCGLENIRHRYPLLKIALRSLWEISSNINELYQQDAANFHANCAETSVMMAVRPDLVQSEKAKDEPDRSSHCFFSYTVADESVYGGVGKPSDATTQFGRRLLDACIETLSQQLKKALVEKTPLETMPPSVPMT